AALDQLIQFLLQPVENLIVGERTEGLAAPLQVDEVGATPQTQVRIVGLTGSIDSATHHGDGDRVLPRVFGSRLYLLGEFHEGTVFDTRAAGAADDVQGVQPKINDAADAAGGDVRQDLL